MWETQTTRSASQNGKGSTIGKSTSRFSQLALKNDVAQCGELLTTDTDTDTDTQTQTQT